MAFISTRSDYGYTPPKLKVLVQWKGLLPNDTTWEEWETLKGNFQLEDKVFLDGTGDDREQQEGPTERPKRKIIPPKHFSDYV